MNMETKTQLGTDAAVLICDRIERIYHRVRALQKERAKPNEPLRLISLAELMATPLRSRLDAVDDDIDGLEYAVWCIGETLMGIAGHDGMDLVMGLIEDRKDGWRIAPWLDHRWDGATDGRQIWVA